MGESIDGDAPAFKTLEHITSYPVVHDTINTYKSNPYGQKSLDIANTLHSQFAAPVYPYLKTPYSYVSPYIQKADQLGDSVLGKVDETFPVVKTETKDIKDTAVSYAFYPFHKLDESKTYVFDTYGNEYKKCGGDGAVAGVKAMITTSLTIFSDSLTYVGTFLNQKKEQTKQITKEKTSN